VEAPHGNAEDRRRFTHLEATGRLLAGIAPWLESGPDQGEEARLRTQFAEWSRKAIESATDPDSPDSMNFNKGEQPLVDAAFLALAIVRAPRELWQNLDPAAQRRAIAALESTRRIRPPYNNWLLFSAMIEAALSLMGAWWDQARIDYALRTIDTWYKGDGHYGDGPMLHCDYYNSFVIHPFLLNTLDTVSKSSSAWDSNRPEILARAQRYAAVQERLIAPDPPFRRSGDRFATASARSTCSPRSPSGASCPPPFRRSRCVARSPRSCAARWKPPARSMMRVGSRWASAAISRRSQNRIFPPEASICAQRPGCPSDFRQAMLSGQDPRSRGLRNKRGMAHS
jgi:hypothetical protein